MRREYTPDGVPEHRGSTSISRKEINQSCFSFRSDKIFFSDLKDSVWSTLTVTGEFISACKALVEGACQFMSSFHSWKCLRMVLINSLALSPNKTRRGSRHCPLQHLSECLVFLAKDNQLCLVKDWLSPLRISEMFFFIPGFFLQPGWCSSYNVHNLSNFKASHRVVCEGKLNEL